MHTLPASSIQQVQWKGGSAPQSPSRPCCQAPTGLPTAHAHRSRGAEHMDADAAPCSTSGHSSSHARRTALALIPALVPVLNGGAAEALQLKGAPCAGMNGYSLSKCLRDARREQEEDGDTGGMPRGADPGRLVTLPSGREYREILEGNGTRAAQMGDVLEIQYTVYHVEKVVPILLWALGSGFENRDDVDEVYRFRLGDPKSLPAAAVPAVEGMKVGGRRRVLIPPEEGWVDDEVGPRPPTFGGKRRLISHRNEPLLLDVVLVRIV